VTFPRKSLRLYVSKHTRPKTPLSQGSSSKFSYTVLCLPLLTMAKLYFLSTPAVYRRTGTGLFSLLHTNHTHLMQIDYFDVYIYLFKASDSI